MAVFTCSCTHDHFPTQHAVYTLCFDLSRVSLSISFHMLLWSSLSTQGAVEETVLNTNVLQQLQFSSVPSFSFRRDQELHCRQSSVYMQITQIAVTCKDMTKAPSSLQGEVNFSASVVLKICTSLHVRSSNSTAHYKCVGDIDYACASNRLFKYLFKC